MADIWTPGRRFRISGINHEGRPWRLADGLVTLAAAIEIEWPGNHPTDGTVAGAGHDARSPNSDHRPRPLTGPGIVRALDMGELIEDQGIALAEELRASRDPRIRYVIHEARIFSSYPRNGVPPFEWRDRNLGSGDHAGHVHTSVWPSADDDGSPWALTIGGMMLTPDQQTELARFLDDLESINSNVGFVKFVIPWFREVARTAGLDAERIAELEESDEIDALEARIEEIAAGGGPSAESVIAEIIRRLNPA